eukprot:6630838-Prymnesium_polylepis.1
MHDAVVVRVAHLWLLGLDCVAWVFYLSLPATYFYVFIRMVPRYGLDDERLNNNFGFLWSRFKKR